MVRCFNFFFWIHNIRYDIHYSKYTIKVLYRKKSKFLRERESESSFYYGSVRLSYNPYFSACFSVGTVFFSHNKSVGTMFWFIFSAKRTRPIYLDVMLDMHLKKLKRLTILGGGSIKFAEV